MGWKTIIIGSDCKVSLSENRMKLTTGNEYQTFALCDIDTIIFSHDKLVITIPLLTKLVEKNINVVICDSKNDPIGVFQAFNNHSLVFKQLNNQINWKITRKKRLWKLIIEQKINTEIDVLNLLEKNKESQEILKDYKNSVYNNDQTNRESASARVYFRTLFGLDFRREDTNVTNIALNYGYKILASYISKCIVARGFVTQLGIHHIGESNAFNLTYDFIEPFRAIVDIWVFLNIKDKFKAAHKMELVNLLQCKIKVNDKWFRLCDAIEDIIDSYISFLNEKSNDVLKISLSEGIIFNGDD